MPAGRDCTIAHAKAESVSKSLLADCILCTGTLPAEGGLRAVNFRLLERLKAEI